MSTPKLFSATEKAPHRFFIALVTLFACGAWQPLAVGATPVPVEIAPVEQRALTARLSLTGSVTSLRSARLSAATAGQVHSLAVDAGTPVTTGSVLMTLDEELAQWQKRAADAAVEAAQLALDDARRRLEEARVLAPQRSIAESLVRDLQAEVASDTAALRRARAEAGYRDALLDRHRITAPFDGVVSSKLTELGEWVTPGQAVLEVVSTAQLRMEFALAEDHVGLVHPETPLRYWLGDNSEPRSGRVATLIPVADPAARTFTVHASPDKPDARLAPGMSVVAELLLGEPTTSLVVPRDAVLSFADGRSVVWVAAQDDGSTIAREVAIETGRVQGTSVEVTRGLADNMRVIVKGNETLREGQAITILNRP